MLAIAKAEGFAPYAMTFLYGQWHAVEVQAARRVAAGVGVSADRETAIDLRAFDALARAHENRIALAGGDEGRSRWPSGRSPRRPSSNVQWRSRPGRAHQRLE